MLEPPAKRKLSDFVRIWLIPFLALCFVTITLYGISFTLDMAGSTAKHIKDVLFNPSPEGAAASLGNVGQVIAGVLAVAITVVSIIVQLAATRYSSRITDYFIKDRISLS